VLGYFEGTSRHGVAPITLCQITESDAMSSAKFGAISIEADEVYIGEVADGTSYFALRQDGIYYFKAGKIADFVPWGRIIELGLNMTTIRSKHPRTVAWLSRLLASLNGFGVANLDSGECHLVSMVRAPYGYWNPVFSSHDGRGYTRAQVALSDELLVQLAARGKAATLANADWMRCCLDRLAQERPTLRRRSSTIIREILTQCPPP
jgi:hypothetical protein